MINCYCKCSVSDKKLAGSIDDYRYDVAEVVAEPVAETAHIVSVDLDGCPALEHGQRVAAKGDILRVPAAGFVRVHDVRVAAHLLQHPWW